ncbi:MAG: Hpt domain-containing protein [Paenarthrobacter sp.]
MNDFLQPRQLMVDPAVLTRLREELQPDIGFCENFVQDYLALLSVRLDRLRRAVETMDHEAAMDAVLSLKTSSQMVGACRLGDLAGELEVELRAKASGTAAYTANKVRDVLEGIDACTAGTITGLSNTDTASAKNADRSRNHALQ